jgi:hypothetical protein
MVHNSIGYFRPRVPNLGDARGLKVVLTWVHLYQWGDAFDVRGSADTKRSGTPVLDLFPALSNKNKFEIVVLTGV